MKKGSKFGKFYIGRKNVTNRESRKMTKWIVDKAHSTVGFEVTHMMITKIRGQFESFYADIRANDLSDLTTATIYFQFDVESINTRDHFRDRHLRSADFFDVETYPTIDFVSTKITKHGDHYRVVGDLTMKGVTREVTLDVTFSGKVMAPSGDEVYGFEAEAIINREEFGLTWNTLLETGGVVVGKEVKINVQLELTRASSQEIEENIQARSKNELYDAELKEDEIHHVITENLTDYIVIVNNDGIIQYATPSLQAALNINLHSLQQSSFFDIIHPSDRETVRDELLAFFRRTLKKDFKCEFQIVHAEKEKIFVEAEVISVKNRPLVLIVMRDISDRKEVEKAIYHFAFHDSLTNLPNRWSFMNQFRNEVMEGKRTKTELALFYIDLDNFKTINDRWGHDAGDIVLKEVAKRIKSVIRPTDIAARFGGDEFIVLLKDVYDKEEIFEMAKMLLAVIEEPFQQMEQGLTITSSIGISLFPIHGDSPEELIKNADTALSYVKERGKSDYKLFDDLIEHQSLERRLLENALRQGIKEKQFYLEYQPKMNMATNELIGMEALVRWKHPELGVISPGKFIPLAEETGLIVPLGEWVLKESCRQAVKWNEKGYPSLRLSVNVSVRQLEDVQFVEKIKTILDETGLDPDYLELEITESVLANVKSTITVLKEIRKLGVRISVDDFGTGYSSLSYIKDLPIDTLKVDQSFVKDIHLNKESKEIAKAILQLAHSIGLSVIAEGIELKEHVETLKKDGYTLGQGYYYSKPLNVEKFEQYMEMIQEVS